MKSSVDRWRSETLGRDVNLKQWGHFGKPLLLLPTSNGNEEEVENFGLVETLQPLVEAGRIKVYAGGCPQAGLWMDKGANGAEKTASQTAFDTHLFEEVVPRVREDCGSDTIRLMVAGVNVGAHTAVNVAAKHPDAFDVAFGLSGTYDFDRWMGEHFDSDYYFNQPLRFVPNLEGDALTRVRDTLFVLASGTGRWETPDHTRRLAGVLQSKRIPVSMELWGPDADHDWKTWRTMLPLFVSRMA